MQYTEKDELLVYLFSSMTDIELEEFCHLSIGLKAI